MRDHYEKPARFHAVYGQLYICDHPVYNRCTLYLITDKGLAVIQQRFDARTKTTWWSEIAVSYTHLTLPTIATV